MIWMHEFDILAMHRKPTVVVYCWQVKLSVPLSQGFLVDICITFVLARCYYRAMLVMSLSILSFAHVSELIKACDYKILSCTIVTKLCLHC